MARWPAPPAGGAALRQLICNSTFAPLYETIDYDDDEALDASIVRTVLDKK